MNSLGVIIPVLFGAIGGGDFPAGEVSLRNPSACAPVAAFVAYSSLGLEADLGKLSLDCKLDGDGSAAFRDLCQLMQRDHRVVCSCSGFSLGEVESHLYWGGVAIVAVGVPDSQIGHAICITDLHPNGNYVYIDASTSTKELSAAELQGIRLGDVILVSPSPYTLVGREWPLLIIPLCTLTVTFILAIRCGYYFCFGRRSIEAIRKCDSASIASE